jgi:hypothetical protein
VGAVTFLLPRRLYQDEQWDGILDARSVKPISEWEAMVEWFACSSGDGTQPSTEDTRLKCGGTRPLEEHQMVSLSLTLQLI